ncbi:MAG: phenylalanine--tRNA ligase subunit alpha [Bacillota bacterium]
MQSQVEEMRARAGAEIQSARCEDELESLRLKYLGKKGEVTALLKSVGTLPPAERPAFGAAVNSARQDIERLLVERREVMELASIRERVERETIDVTLPGVIRRTGGLHPLTRGLREILDVFYGMGFTVYESRETETDEMNFVKLNLAPGHPARDMQATFYLTENVLLRTHTSPGQIRGMLSRNGKLPVRFVVPGRVYRRDPADASHSPVFHQIEGLVIDSDVTFRNLKWCLLEFARGFFGPDADVRLRPSYFPFTEPSAEVDMSCVFCKGKGCSVCGGSGWLEIAGAGMVHPRVIANGGYDPEKVTGFAFGMGIDRMTMLKYGIGDMRDILANDYRFLAQFRGL